jgi:hypothetical protein
MPNEQQRHLSGLNLSGYITVCPNSGLEFSMRPNVKIILQLFDFEWITALLA